MKLNYIPRKLILICLLGGLIISNIANASFPAGPKYLSTTAHSYRCAIGKSGVTDNKHEGDGATPLGKFYLREVYYRPDRLQAEQIKTSLPVKTITRSDGWCDDPEQPQYNQHVTLPFKGHYESLWREDHLYDVVVVVGYNDQPAIKNKGSAIFFHVAHPSYKPTDGCIAVALKDLLMILPSLSDHSQLSITRQKIILEKNP